MKLKLFAIILPALLMILCACGGGQPATTEALPTEVQLPDSNNTAATPLQDNAFTPLPEGTLLPPNTPLATIEGALVPGGPGTLVASKTEDPDAGMPFTSLRLERSYGPDTGEDTSIPMIIEIKADGTITRDDKTGKVSQQMLDQLNAMLREMNYFGISSDFLGLTPIEGSGEYLYKITVVRGSMESMIPMRDSLLVQPFRDLIVLVVNEATRLG
ncbi:MAG TPA: hypothetical protein VHL11_07875 [Phototrophicaceae bacterium]|jgi:hypothetical protein|nr:hypothetical protein [Phototrophicaceae bacterium]